jgi:hypothetical protein
MSSLHCICGIWIVPLWCAATCLHGATVLCVRCEQTNASSVGGLVIVDWPTSDGGVELTAVAITLDLLPPSMNSSSNGTNGSTTALPLDTSSLCVGDGYGFLADLTPVVSRSQPVAVAIAGLTGGCR